MRWCRSSLSCRAWRRTATASSLITSTICRRASCRDQGLPRRTRRCGGLLQGPSRYRARDLVALHQDSARGPEADPDPACDRDRRRVADRLLGRDHAPATDAVEAARPRERVIAVGVWHVLVFGLRRCESARCDAASQPGPGVARPYDEG